MRPVSLRVHAGLLFVQATFGAFHVIGKGVIAVLPPLAVAGIRVAVAIPLLLALAWVVDHRLPERRDLPLLALLGLLGVFANQVLYILGLQWTTATSAGILMPSIPVFAVAAGALLGVERLHAVRTLGVVLAVGGALVLLDPVQLALGDRAFWGNLLIGVNCGCYAFYLVLQRPLLDRLPPLTVVAWAFLFGGLGTLVVSHRQVLRVSAIAVPGKTWAGLAFIVLIATVVNYALIGWALRHSSPALVATYTTLQPAFAAVLAAIFLGEQPTLRQLGGFALIVAGLMVTATGGSGQAGKESTASASCS